MRRRSRRINPTSPNGEKKEDEDEMRAANEALLEKMKEDEEEIRAVNKALLEKYHELPAKHDETTESVKAAQAQIEGLPDDSKTRTQSKENKLAVYKTAQEHCATERTALQGILDELERLRKLRFEQKRRNLTSRGSLMTLLVEHASSLPLFTGNVEGPIPSLVGAIPLSPEDPIGAKDDLVAAYGAGEEDVWLLAEIVEAESLSSYKVRDIEDVTSLKNYSIPRDRLIALPHYRADPRRHADALFPKDAVVLALFPRTTCFYKAIVDTPPAGPNDEYFIAFEDERSQTGYSPPVRVVQMFVITFKEKPKKTNRRKSAK
ncbi:SGF29 tudor-like domain-containing protein [Ditylenchus destructor]|uniref:SGF29 tudor-like domain-containing protein n=1 Tax=Ditylenchus destructor TaxID=166010 RepID=A0AAD4QU75_9BILA|nr:SGF29 tudor-like domain-containing protein [Ditylenchus destructor]